MPTVSNYENNVKYINTDKNTLLHIHTNLVTWTEEFNIFKICNTCILHLEALRNTNLPYFSVPT